MAPVTDRPHRLLIRTEPDDSGGGGVAVSVEDSGVGLDPAREGRLFEPFFTTKPNGMGMGLMICRSIVEAHGGRLIITGHTPHGAIARFTLAPAVDDPGTHPS